MCKRPKRTPYMAKWEWGNIVWFLVTFVGLYMIGYMLAAMS